MISDISARQEERAFAEVKRASSAGLEGPELLSRVARSLGHTVSFGAYCASTVDPATNLMTYGVIEGMGEGGTEDDDVFFDRIYFEESLGRTSSMLRERRLVESLSEVTGGRPERSLRYREQLEPMGFAHEVSSVFAEGGGLWGVMDLSRRVGAADFAPRAVRLLTSRPPLAGDDRARRPRRARRARRADPRPRGKDTLPHARGTPLARGPPRPPPRLAGERYPRAPQDGRRRPQACALPRGRAGPKPRAEGAHARPFGALDHALRLPHGIFLRTPGRDGGGHRAGQGRGGGLAQRRRIRPEPEGGGDRETGRARPVHQADSGELVRLRAHRSAPPTERFREGGREEPPRANEAAVLREPLARHARRLGQHARRGSA